VKNDSKAAEAKTNMGRDASARLEARHILSRALMSAGMIAVCAAAAAQVPLPPVRPPDLTAPAPVQQPAPATAAPPATTAVQPNPADNDMLRTQVLASGRLIGEALPPISDKGGCMIAAPVRLDAILLADGAKVLLLPAVVMRASLASAVADWVREDLSAAVAKGDRLASIEGVGAYECRNRDSVVGAKLSEHALGNALDLHALRTEHGKLFVIAPAKDDTDDVLAFRALMKKTACARFSTVLGPGSDAFHALHLHVDLAVRRNGMHLCQWDAEPPAPAPSAPKP
jgi:hypothetical protein